MIEFANGNIQVDAKDIALVFQLPPDEEIAGIRCGTIARNFEPGYDDGAARHRETMSAIPQRCRQMEVEHER